MRRALTLMVGVGLALAGPAIAQSRAPAFKSADWPSCDTGAPEQQIASCGKIIAAGGETPAAMAWAHYRRGNGYQDTGDAKRALTDYAAAAKLNPTFAEPHNAEGIVHFEGGAYAAALAAYDRALQIDPKNWRAWNNRGNALRRLTRLPDAIAAYGKAIEFNASVPAIWTNRGGVYLDSGDAVRAITDFGRAIQLDRQFADAYLLRGMAYTTAKNAKLALPDLNEYLRQRPAEAAGYQARGAAYAFLGDMAKAQADYEKAIALAPRDAANFLIRGNLLSLQGEDAKAVADYDAALKLKPGDAATLAGRGTSLFRLERYDPAIADLKQAMALDPKMAWLKPTLDSAVAAKVALAKRAAAAAGPPKLEKRVALVIGNSKYVNISPLKNAARDAASIAAKLKASGYTVYGYPKTDMTRAQMFDAIKAFEAAAAGADTAFIWYAGHGQEFETGGQQAANWLIPVDFAPNGDIAEGGVPLSRLITAASPARALRVVVIDACRNNNLPSSTRGSRGFRVEERSDMLIVFSTRAGRLADDGDGANSPFAHAFLEEMESSAKLDVRQFFGGVAERVDTLTRDSGNPQEPERIDRMRSRHTLALAP